MDLAFYLLNDVPRYRPSVSQEIASEKTLEISKSAAA